MIIFQAAVFGGMKGQKYQKLTKQILLEYLKSEYSVFYIFLKLMFDMKFKKRHGNVFAQVIHDAVTMVNHKKYQSLDLQFVGPFWNNNLVVCCGFAYQNKMLS